MGAYRFVFNASVSHKEECYKSEGKSPNYFTYRKDLTEKLRSENPWLEGIPAHTVYGAMRDADQAYALVIKKRAKKQISELPRCRKHRQKSFFILGDAITENGIYPRLLGKIKSSEKLPNKPCDSRIIFTGNKWYLRFPYERQVQRNVAEKNGENQARLCALDLGIRTFATVFSNNGISKIAQGSFSRIVRLCLALDDLISRTSKIKNKTQKRRYFIAIARARKVIQDLIYDLHWQAASWVCKNYDVIAIGEADFSSAVLKANRKIRSKTARMLMSFGYAKFRERLIHKAALLGKKVVVIDESYTSKTANWTGEVVQNLGGSKTITSGGIRLDRDVNGSFGIFLKALLAQPLLKRAQLLTKGNKK